MLQKSTVKDKAMSGMATIRRQSLAADSTLRPGSSDQSDNTDDDDEDDDDVKAAYLEG